MAKARDGRHSCLTSGNARLVANKRLERIQASPKTLAESARCVRQHYAGASQSRCRTVRRPELPSAEGRPWDRDEHVIAFNLYSQIPFGTIHMRNPRVIEL